MIISSKYIWILILGALTACQKQEEPILAEQQPIVFKSFLKEGDRITPISRSLGGDLTEGYLLGGAWTVGPYLTSSKMHFYGSGVPEREMRVDGTPKDPNAPRLYWNTDGKTLHTFYAYTANPGETPSGFGVTEARKFTSYTESNSQGISLLFRQPDDPAKQIDLLVADNSNIVVTTGDASAVNLYFQHRLSKVSIKVFGTGGANLTSCQAKVTYGATAPKHGVGSTTMAGVFIVKDANGEYELSGSGRLIDPRHIGTYNLGPHFTVSNNQASELDASHAGSMILVPQPLATDGWAKITLEYSIDGALVRNTAKLDLPAITQLYPTKEYVFALNLIERSSILTVASVKLVDWISQNEIIDNLPGEYSLSLSTTKPTDAVIPTVGKAYKINVISSRGWAVSKSQYTTITPSSGKKGTTEVMITVPVNVDVKRNAYVVFSTVGAVESMVSATWMGEQATAKVERTETSNLIWTTDGGLYFQFGSLIGWKGGATGRASKKDVSFYSGSSFNSVNEVAVAPKEYKGIGGLLQWTQDVLPYNQLFFSFSEYGNNKSISEFPGFPDGRLAYVGVGDPCRYYLKGTWLLPRVVEFDTDLVIYNITHRQTVGTNLWHLRTSEA